MAEITKGEATNGNDETAQAQVDIWRFVFGFAEMAVTKCAIELGIPDILENHGDPMTLSLLSTALSCSSTALFRVMRFLMNRGIFKEKITKEGSMGACVLDNNTSAFAYAHGKDTWKYAAENPGHNKFFDEAMACDTRRTIPAVLNGCPELFTGVSSVVDVGGGDGTALHILIKKCPWIHGMNFDLSHVLSSAPECEGIEHVGGDMFISVPKAIVAFLKVLHLNINKL
ncbi:hypothetical protein AgCh_025718 [Apium graveolens]